MGNLSVLLLIIAFGYLFVKGIFFLLIYLQTYRVEKRALSKQRRLHELLAEQRAKEQQKYRKAYELSGVRRSGEIEGI